MYTIFFNRFDCKDEKSKVSERSIYSLKAWLKQKDEQKQSSNGAKAVQPPAERARNL